MMRVNEEKPANKMHYRAIIKKSEGWWIGWLVDLPGVNAQEKTKAEVLKSLKIGAQHPVREVKYVNC